jgi:hypothetical protein
MKLHVRASARMVTTAGALVLAVTGLAGPAQAARVPAGNAPQCIQTTAWDSGAYSYQRAVNNCGQAYRIKLVWAVASTHCETLHAGHSRTGWVFRPAWAGGANLC